MEQKEKQFSIVKRAKSFTHAGRGLWILFKTTHNIWVHASLLVFVVVLGFVFSINTVDWILIILAAGMVLSAEAFNTAIEIDIDLTSPEYHPSARDTKDVAAGAVLIAAVAAASIGVLVFVPYILKYLSL